MTQRQSQVRVLTIQEFADLCRTTPRTLRFYEQKGLFTPAGADRFTGYRYYTQDQAKEFLRIKLLQHFEFPLRSIKDIVHKRRIEESLDDQLDVLRQAIETQQKEYEFIQRMKSFLFDQEDLDKLVVEETLGPFELFTYTVGHGSYTEVDGYHTHIEEMAKRLKIKHTSQPMTFYETNTYKPKNIEIEVALICSGEPNRNKELPPGFSFRPFPKTKAVTFTHHGDYDYFILLYQKLNAYFFSKGYTLTGKVFDLYEKNFLNTKSQYDYVTRLCYPIA